MHDNFLELDITAAMKQVAATGEEVILTAPTTAPDTINIHEEEERQNATCNNPPLTDGNSQSTNEFTTAQTESLALGMSMPDRNSPIMHDGASLGYPGSFIQANSHATCMNPADPLPEGMMTEYFPTCCEQVPFVTSNELSFHWRHDGLYGHMPGKQARTVHICSSFSIVKTLTDPDGVAIAKQLQIGFRTVTLMMVNIHGKFQKCIEILIKNGLIVKEEPRAPRLLRAFLLEHPARENALGTFRPGWHWQDVIPYGQDHISRQWHFVLPWFTVAPEGTPAPIYLGNTSTPLARIWTLEDWQNNVGTYCRGNTRFVFGIAFALSSVFFQDFSLSGCILHLFGSTSIGKSTLLAVVASICPRAWEESYRTWRVTANGLESLLEKVNDYFVLFDEIAEITPSDLGEAIYMIANGPAKLRRTDRQGQGNLDVRVAVISSGEVSIRSHLVSGRRKYTGGHAVRSLDLPAQPEKGHGIFEHVPSQFDCPAGFSRYLKHMAKKYAGSVAPALLREVVRDKEAALARVEAHRRSFLQGYPQPFDAQIERVVQYFALAAAAGEYAIESGVLPFAKGESFKAARVCFQDWLAHYRQNTLSETDKIREHLYMVLRQYGESKFLHYLGGKSKELNGAYGYKLSVGAQTEYILPKEGFEKMFEGFEPGIVRSELKCMGMLQVAKRDLQVYRTLPNSGRTKCTVILVDVNQYLGDS